MPRIRAASIDEHKALTRRSLLECAKELIAEAGTAEIPIAEVALAAGVGRTTLYDYFDDRDDLIAAIVEEELPDVLDAIIASVPAADPPSARLADLTGAMVRFVATDPVLGVILHRDVGRLGLDAQTRIREAHSSLADEIVELYYLGVERGEFRPMPARLAARLIQDVVMSGAKALMMADGSDDEADDITSNLEVFLISGLRAADIKGWVT